MESTDTARPRTFRETNLTTGEVSKSLQLRNLWWADCIFGDHSNAASCKVAFLSAEGRRTHWVLSALINQLQPSYQYTEAGTTPVGAVAGHDFDLQPLLFATLLHESGLVPPTLVWQTSTIENTSHADSEVAENQVKSPDQIPADQH